MTIYILASIKNCKSTDLLKYVNFRSTEVDFRRTGNTKKKFSLKLSHQSAMTNEVTADQFYTIEIQEYRQKDIPYKYRFCIASVKKKDRTLTLR